jgi:hypothetical protein
MPEPVDDQPDKLPKTPNSQQFAFNMPNRVWGGAVLDCIRQDSVERVAFDLNISGTFQLHVFAAKLCGIALAADII